MNNIYGVYVVNVNCFSGVIVDNSNLVLRVNLWRKFGILNFYFYLYFKGFFDK